MINMQSLKVILWAKKFGQIINTLKECKIASSTLNS